MFGHIVTKNYNCNYEQKGNISHDGKIGSYIPYTCESYSKNLLGSMLYVSQSCAVRVNQVFFT